jgi:hypothetical protein
VLPYAGTRKLEDLPLRILDEKTEAIITERGRKVPSTHRQRSSPHLHH